MARSGTERSGTVTVSVFRVRPTAALELWRWERVLCQRRAKALAVASIPRAAAAPAVRTSASRASPTNPPAPGAVVSASARTGARASPRRLAERAARSDAVTNAATRPPATPIHAARSDPTLAAAPRSATRPTRRAASRVRRRACRRRSVAQRPRAVRIGSSTYPRLTPVTWPSETGTVTPPRIGMPSPSAVAAAAPRPVRARTPGQRRKAEPDAHRRHRYMESVMAGRPPFPVRVPRRAYAHARGTRRDRPRHPGGVGAGAERRQAARTCSQPAADRPERRAPVQASRSSHPFFRASPSAGAEDSSSPAPWRRSVAGRPPV